MLPGAGVYNHPMNQQAMQLYQRPRTNRRIGDAVVSLRSPLLDEFRADKSRNWDLRVRRL